MKFTKMEGLGNDFVVVGAEVSLDRTQIRWLCDRHFGIGADGVLRVGLHNAQVRMEYWNADGSDAEMCGNGLRCVARFARENHLVEGDKFSVSTPVGDRWVFDRDEPRVELGPVMLGSRFQFEGLTFHRVMVGNPHAVTVVEDTDLVDVPGIGSRLERSTPGGINVGFVAPGNHLRLRVWERGSGETLACGSGMAAAAAVAREAGIGSDQVAIDVPGGKAQIELELTTSWLTGPARSVFSGEVDLPV